MKQNIKHSFQKERPMSRLENYIMTHQVQSKKVAISNPRSQERNRKAFSMIEFNAESVKKNRQNLGAKKIQVLRQLGKVLNDAENKSLSKAKKENILLSRLPKNKVQQIKIVEESPESGGKQKKIIFVDEISCKFSPTNVRSSNNSLKKSAGKKSQICIGEYAYIPCTLQTLREKIGNICLSFPQNPAFD